MNAVNFRDHRIYLRPLFSVLLRHGGGAVPETIYDEVADLAGVSAEDRSVRGLRLTDNVVFKNRIQFARQSLIDAGLVIGSDSPGWRRSYWQLSDDGTKLGGRELAPDRLEKLLLAKAVEGARLRAKRRKMSMELAGLEEPVDDAENEKVAESDGVSAERANADVLDSETLRNLVQAANRTALETMLDHVRGMNDRAFEYLVGAVLKAALRAESVNVTQKSRDGGIDGVLMFDSLGIRIAVFEAKRYEDGNKVARSQIDAFATAARRRRAAHSLFVTSSTFSAEAIESARDEGVRLIDGNVLVELMAQHSIGFRQTERLPLYAIDPAWSVDSGA
jgi:restriction system protein